MTAVKEAQEKNTENEAQAHVSMATHYFKLNKYAESYEYFNKAKTSYEKSGDEKEVYTQLRNMGIVKENLNHLTQAMQHYSESKKGFESLEDYDEMGETSYRIATCLYRDGKKDEAVKEYEYSASKKCKNANIYNNLGFLQMESGELEKAEENLMTAVTMETEDVKELIYNNLGVVNYLKGDYKKAIEHLTKSLEISNTDKPKTDRTIQYIVFCNDKYQETANEKYSIFDEVITQASACLNMAASYIKTGENDKALEYCKKASEIDGSMPYIQLPSAWIYLALDDKDKAISYLKNAMQSNPEKTYIKDIVTELNPYAFIKVDRNEDCPCGSGKKFKKCHGKNI